MTAPATLYGISEVADRFKVTRTAVVNWRNRYDDVPPPDYLTPSGTPYWADLDGWESWRRTWAGYRRTIP